MKTVLSCLGLLLGAGFMLTQLATTPLPGTQRYWHASAAIVVVLVGGMGWLIGWLVGWALGRFAKHGTAEQKKG